MAEKPNIVFLLNDHQCYYGHGESVGAPKIKRPTFDKLAKGGVKFTRAYTACPLCGPARRTMLTGLFPHNHGEIKNNSNAPWQETYLDVLATKGGYKNYYFGKWHAGKGTAKDHHCEGFCYRSYNNPYKKPEYKEYLKRYNLPMFQVRIEGINWKSGGVGARFYGIKVGKLFTPKRPWCNEHAIGTMTTPKETHESFFLANLACEQLEKIAKSGDTKPFHLRVDFWGPHQPYYATQEYLDMYDPEKIPESPNFRDDLNNKPESYKREVNYPMGKKKKLIIPNPLPWSYYQNVLKYNYAQQTLIDDAAGLILKKLDELGLSDNTLVIWSTDHGDALGCHGGHFDKAWYLPEEMMRIPMAIRFPSQIPSGQISEKFVSNMDIPSTILDAAGLSFSNPVDGESMLSISKEPSASWRDDLMLETHGHPNSYLGRVLIYDRYKYVWNYEDLDELYDLKADPFELNNLIDDRNYTNVLNDMKKRLKKWRENTGDNIEFKMIGLFKLKKKK